MADMKGKSREEVIAADVKELHKLGYAQQLFREMGGFSNFAISFSIISILTGAMLLYGYGLKFAGPRINTIGWPLVSVFTLCIAASMAEIASAYPTAGGLYYWSSKLGGVGWGWWTAWMNMVGQITITAGIDIAVAIYGVGLVTRVFGLDPAAPVFGGLFGWTLSSWGFYLFIMVIVMIPQVWINIYGIKLTARLNDFSVYWHIVGVLIIAILMFFFGHIHNSLELRNAGWHRSQPPGRLVGRFCRWDDRPSPGAGEPGHEVAVLCALPRLGERLQGGPVRLRVRPGLPAGAVDLHRL